MYKEDYDYERENFDKLLRIGQRYNVNGVISPLRSTLKMVLKIIRTIPRITWIETLTTDRIYSRNSSPEEPQFVPNNVTHFNTSLGTYE